MGLTEIGSWASIGSFFQGLWAIIKKPFCPSEAKRIIGKRNVAGYKIKEVGGNAEIDESPVPKSTIIGKDNIGGTAIDVVDKDLIISPTDQTDKTIIIGEGNIGGHSIGHIGGNLQIGDNVNNFTIEERNFNAGIINFGEIKIIKASKDPEILDDLKKLACSLSVFKNAIDKYSPDELSRKTSKEQMSEEFNSIREILANVRYNIPQNICNSVENYIAYSRMLTGLSDRLLCLGKIKEPKDEYEIKLIQDYHQDFQLYLDNCTKLDHGFRQIEEAIKTARGIE